MVWLCFTIVTALYDTSIVFLSPSLCLCIAKFRAAPHQETTQNMNTQPAYLQQITRQFRQFTPFAFEQIDVRKEFLPFHFVDHVGKSVRFGI